MRDDGLYTGTAGPPKTGEILQSAGREEFRLSPPHPYVQHYDFFHTRISAVRFACAPRSDRDTAYKAVKYCMVMVLLMLLSCN